MIASKVGAVTSLQRPDEAKSNVVTKKPVTVAKVTEKRANLTRVSSGVLRVVWVHVTTGSTPVPSTEA